MLGLDDLKGFFQPKLFYDSMGGHLQFQVLLLLGKQQQMYNNSSDVYEDIYHWGEPVSAPLMIQQ